MAGNFWLRLKKRKQPILALAPLAGFTDSAFRQICKKYGADVVYSEMASVSALFYTMGSDSSDDKNSSLSKAGKTKGALLDTNKIKVKKNVTLELLKFDRRLEKNYVVQLFGASPEYFAFAARLITKKIKPDGIDINFGCPVPKIVKQGAGSGLMSDLERSRAVIKAVLDNTNLPVSIKIRAKSGEVDALSFLKNISDLPVSAVMIHGRTLKQGFFGEPDFELIKKARIYFKGVILANGGINNLSSAKKALTVSKADGLGLARGVLGRPWLFKEIKKNKEINLKSNQIFNIALKHSALEQKQKGKQGIIESRKHLVWYVQGLVGAAKLRERLVKVNSLKDVRKILKVK